MNHVLRKRPAAAGFHLTPTILLALLTGISSYAVADDAIPTLRTASAPETTEGAQAESAVQRTSPVTTSSAAGNPEFIELDATTISGHRELPRVMHVVPWKRALPADLQGRPVNSLLEDVLAPVDRDVFRRQLRYHNALADSASTNHSGNPSQNPGD